MATTNFFGQIVQLQLNGVNIFLTALRNLLQSASGLLDNMDVSH
jgi:hypothetical protein